MVKIGQIYLNDIRRMETILQLQGINIEVNNFTAAGN